MAVTLSGLLWVHLRGIFKHDILIGCGCSGYQPLRDKAGRQGYKELFVKESWKHAQTWEVFLYQLLRHLVDVAVQLGVGLVFPPLDKVHRLLSSPIQRNWKPETVKGNVVLSIKVSTDLNCLFNKIQTHRRFKIMLFIRTKHFYVFGSCFRMLAVIVVSDFCVFNRSSSSLVCCPTSRFWRRWHI